MFNSPFIHVMQPEIVPPTPKEDAAIVAAALADPDAQPLTDAQLNAMAPMHALKAKGRPKSPHRKLLVF